MALPKNDVLTGARARLSIGGFVIGFATNVSVREGIRYEAIEVLDNIEVQEHVPVGYDVSMTAGRVRLVNRSLRSATTPLMPKLGVDAQQHLINIVALTPMEAVIEDPINPGVIVMLMEQVRVADHNFSVSARGVWSEDVSFVAIRVRDETET